MPNRGAGGRDVVRGMSRDWRLRWLGPGFGARCCHWLWFPRNKLISNNIRKYWLAGWGIYDKLAGIPIENELMTG